MNEDTSPRLTSSGVVSGPPNLSDLGEALLSLKGRIVLFQDLVLGFEMRYDRIATEGLKHLAKDMAEQYHHIMAIYHQINK
jgi:hypothetical protein